MRGLLYLLSTTTSAHPFTLKCTTILDPCSIILYQNLTAYNLTSASAVYVSSSLPNCSRT